eukprot:1564893-Rhodomonas_salina.3
MAIAAYLQKYTAVLMFTRWNLLAGNRNLRHGRSGSEGDGKRTMIHHRGLMEGAPSAMAAPGNV